VKFEYQPSARLSLEGDIERGKRLYDVIVTTRDGTGKETLLEKLKLFREIMGDFPLFVGAGVTSTNVLEQLAYTDGAIVGSFFKDGNTMASVNPKRVKEFMSEVRKAY